VSPPTFALSTADFSPDGVYRYALHRSWRGLFDAVCAPRVCLFVMLNPSTADARVLDPTVRRCVAYAAAWGYDTLVVGNLFALRSTDPSVLEHHADPVGPDNDAWLERLAHRADRIVAGWGNHGALHGRGAHVVQALSRVREVHALHVTREGEPGHPLYLPKFVEPFVYRARAVDAVTAGAAS